MGKKLEVIWGIILLFAVQALHADEVPPVPLKLALEYYKENAAIITNKRWLSVIDFTQPSWEKRLYVMDMAKQTFTDYYVAHGFGSDPKDTGYAKEFSNVVNSKMSSLGFYLVAESYVGQWGRSARLDGLSKSNSKARERAVVLHGAKFVKKEGGKQGRSEGCPTVELDVIINLVEQLSGGSLLFIYGEGFS